MKHLVTIIILLFTFIIFFREEVLAILKKFEKYPYALMGFIFVTVNYFLLWNADNINHFIAFISYNVLSLKRVIYHLLSYVFTFQQIDSVSNIILRALIFGFCIFYPYYYEKKHASLIYRTQSYTINVIYTCLTLFFCIFLAKINLANVF